MKRKNQILTFLNDNYGMINSLMCDAERKTFNEDIVKYIKEGVEKQIESPDPDKVIQDAEKRKETECGHIVIEGSRTSAAYQDLVGILLANDYAVELTPLDDHRKLEVIIRKGR